jgi:asparagine synthase (glutamine-hydrolysing)
MCGISGFVGRGDQKDIEAMTSVLTHRGPDSHGFYHSVDNSIYLGHRRLTIRDLQFGAQPMTSHGGDITIVFNGEVYNYTELRVQLESRGHIFVEGHSDTEVLLHGYREWGQQLPERLNGMWAFAIYDRKRRNLFLSRDRFGQKPLFYTLQGKTFAFASELKSLEKHRQLSFKISTLGAQKYLAHGYFPHETTIYQKVQQLPAGHNLLVNLSELSLEKKRYWSYQIEPDTEKSEKYWINSIREKLSQAVKRRMVSDAPLGIFLSGGLDSSAVALYASQAMGSEGSLQSFSIAFEDPSFDETRFALEVSRLTKTEHSYITFKKEQVQSLMQRMFAGMDAPLSDSSMMSYFLLCEFSSKKIKVALGGDAGDEIFAGYDTFRAMKMSKMIEKICPNPMHKAVLAMSSYLPKSHGYMPLQFKLNRLFKGYGHPKSLWNPLWLGPVSISDIGEIVSSPVDLEEIYSEAIESWDSCQQKDLIDRTLSFYGNLFLTDQILVKVDRMSMAHSLEVRTPFLDIDLIDCVRRIPNYFKLKGYGQPKYILKKAMDGPLPSHIVWRKKLGFSAPIGKWLTNGVISFNSSSSWSSSAQKFIGSRSKEHRELQKDHRLFLWNTFVIDQFMKSNRGFTSSAEL